MPRSRLADTGASPEGQLFMLVDHGGGPAKLVPYAGPKTPKSKARVRATPTAQRITPQARAKPKPRPAAKEVAKRVSFAPKTTPKAMNLLKAMSGPGDPEYLRQLFELKERFIGKSAMASSGAVDITPGETRRKIIDQTFQDVMANLPPEQMPEQTPEQTLRAAMALPPPEAEYRGVPTFQATDVAPNEAQRAPTINPYDRSPFVPQATQFPTTPEGPAPIEQGPRAFEAPSARVTNALTLIQGAVDRLKELAASETQPAAPQQVPDMPEPAALDLPATVQQNSFVLQDPRAVAAFNLAKRGATGPDSSTGQDSSTEFPETSGSEFPPRSSSSSGAAPPAPVSQRRPKPKAKARPGVLPEDRLPYEFTAPYLTVLNIIEDVEPGTSREEALRGANVFNVLANLPQGEARAKIEDALEEDELTIEQGGAIGATLATIAAPHAIAAATKLLERIIIGRKK